MLCQAFERKDFEIFLVGQGVLQMNKILCNCIHELLNVLEDSAQHVHTIMRSLLEPSISGHYNQVVFLKKWEVSIMCDYCDYQE